jgi:hypothetical protein
MLRPFLGNNSTSLATSFDSKAPGDATITNCMQHRI